MQISTCTRSVAILKVANVTDIGEPPRSAAIYGGATGRVAHDVQVRNVHSGDLTVWKVWPA